MKIKHQKKCTKKGKNKKYKKQTNKKEKNTEIEIILKK